MSILIGGVIDKHSLHNAALLLKTATNTRNKAIMQTIANHPGVNQTELLEHQDLERFAFVQSDLSTCLKKLENKSLIISEWDSTHKRYYINDDRCHGINSSISNFNSQPYKLTDANGNVIQGGKPKVMA